MEIRLNQTATGDDLEEIVLEDNKDWMVKAITQISQSPFHWMQVTTETIEGFRVEVNEIMYTGGHLFDTLIA